MSALAHADRFWSKVDRCSDVGCWIWTASTNDKGYGNFSIGGRLYKAHRFAYELERGAIPEGLVLDHLCDTPACVNPNHLRACTQRENTLRSPISLPSIRIRKTHCYRGHEFTEANTRIQKRGGYTTRSCKACELERVRRSRAR